MAKLKVQSPERDRMEGGTRSGEDVLGPCHHCGYVWMAQRHGRRPIRCARCKKARWDRGERKTLGLPT